MEEIRLCQLRLYTLPHNSNGVLYHHGHPCVCLSLHPFIHPYFYFGMIVLVNVNLVYALILWRSSFRLLVGKFCQFLAIICPRPVHFFFLSDNLSKYK